MASRGKAADQERQRRAQLAQLKFDVSPLIRAIATNEHDFERMVAPAYRLATASGFDAPIVCLLRERDGKGRLPSEWARMTRKDRVAEVSIDESLFSCKASLVLAIACRGCH
jgi:hypothetical protein